MEDSRALQDYSYMLQKVDLFRVWTVIKFCLGIYADSVFRRYCVGVWTTVK